MLEQQSLISGYAKEAVCVVWSQLTRLLLHIIHIPSDPPSTISLLPLSLPHRRLMDCIISLILQLPGGEERAEFTSRQYEWWVEAAAAEKGALVGTVRVEGLEAPNYSLEHSYTEPVPMQIDPLSGVITITSGDSQWKDAYTLQVRSPNSISPTPTNNNTKVRATSGEKSVTAGVIVHMTRQEEEQGEKEEAKDSAGVLTVSVRENAPAGTVVANLTTLQLQNRGRVGADHLIANQDAREKFVLTDASLLVTSGPLDREERESYMVTIVLGRY